jgi:hypothetical protein
MWAELLFFLLVLGLAVQQLYSVKKAQRKTAEEEAARQRREAEEPPKS